MKRLTGTKAIEYAETTGMNLHKYADPIDGAREGLTVAEATEIAREDPSLIYVDVDDDGGEGEDMNAKVFTTIDDVESHLFDLLGDYTPSDYERNAIVQEARKWWDPATGVFAPPTNWDVGLCLMELDPEPEPVEVYGFRVGETVYAGDPDTDDHDTGVVMGYGAREGTVEVLWHGGACRTDSPFRTLHRMED